jgi:EmrB/QacA subfamily drug resistance transporter
VATRESRRRGRSRANDLDRVNEPSAVTLAGRFHAMRRGSATAAVLEDLPETSLEEPSGEAVALLEGSGSRYEHGVGGATGFEEPVAAQHRALIFFIVSMALFMASIDGTIVATALPRIGDSLHARLNWLGWTITIYQLGQIIAMPLAGKISDQFGRKKVFIVCAVIFTVTSFVCGLSTSIYMLVPLRFVQALGGGAFMPSATGIVSDTFGRDRDRALGMFTSIFPIGGICGPVFGGLIAGYWSWRGIFFINIPIGIALIILAIRFIPHKAPSDAGRLDYRGVTLLCTTIIFGMLAITTLGEKGVSPTDPIVVVSSVAAIVLGYLFVRHTKHAPAPFIPIALLRGKGFSTMNILNTLYGSAALGFGALVPLYAENRYHISITTAGTVLSARAVGMISVAAISAMMLRRTGYRLPMTIGFIALAVGLFFLSITPHGLSPYWWLALFALLTGLGMGCAGPATNNATLQLAPDQVAAIAGLRGMFRQTGGILYVSIATAVLARSAHPASTQAHIFVIQAVVVAVMIGLVYIVPDHRGTW